MSPTILKMQTFFKQHKVVAEILDQLSAQQFAQHFAQPVAQAQHCLSIL
jgi:hypothetical protein